MGFRAFLQKEWYGSRRNLAVLLVLLVILPGAAALGTAAFQHTIPQDIPIGVAPDGENVTEDEISVIKGGTAMYASPERYESPDSARAALEREDVYLVIEVPHGLFNESADVNVTLVSDQRMAPFQDPANYTESSLSYHLDRQFPADVTVNHQRIGVQQTLSEYLVPTALLSMVILFGFLYLPLELHREQAIFERVELASRVEAALAAKLVFYGVLLVVPVMVFQLVGLWLGYRVNHFNPHALAIIALTFIYVSSTSAGVMFFTRLKRVGVFLNMGLLAAVFTLSSFVYPVGFFSAVRKEIALMLPSYHSMVIVRSALLKGTPLSAFTNEVAYLLGVTVVSLVFLQASIMYYRRST